MTDVVLAGESKMIDDTPKIMSRKISPRNKHTPYRFDTENCLSRQSCAYGGLVPLVKSRTANARHASLKYQKVKRGTVG